MGGKLEHVKFTIATKIDKTLTPSPHNPFLFLNITLKVWFNVFDPLEKSFQCPILIQLSCREEKHPAAGATRGHE